MLYVPNMYHVMYYIFPAFSTLTFKKAWTKDKSKAEYTSTDNLVTKPKLKKSLSGPKFISSQIESSELEEDNIEIPTYNSCVDLHDDVFKD